MLARVLLVATTLVGLGDVLPSCGPKRPPAPPAQAAAPADARPAARVMTESRTCMGTVCEIKVFHDDEAVVRKALDAAFDELARIEALTTSWRESSEVSRINAAAGVEAVKVSPEVLAIVKKAMWIAKLTDGAFDITVGVYKGLWKFDEDNDGSLPAKADVLARRKLVAYRDVIVDEAASTVQLRRKGQRMNLEGLAKGFAVDAAVAALRARGVPNFIVHAGGDLYAGGNKGGAPWKVGIQDPRGPHGRVIYVLELEDRAFNTSGDYERFIIKDGVRYHHILDARTGFPARGTRGVTVLAKDAFTADTLDTALFAVGPKRAMEIVEAEPDVEAVIVDDRNRVYVSSGLEGKLVKVGEPTDGI